MIHSFITDKDLLISIKQYFLDQVTIDESTRKPKCEAAAFTMIKSKLNNRYDLVKLFPETKEWDSARAYLKDEYCFNNEKFFKALQNATNQNPNSQLLFWKESDPRDMLLVKLCADITLYFILESINPRKVSDDVINAYTNAMEWLDDVKNNIEHPAWPLLENGLGTLKWGSNTKLDHYY